MHMSDNRWSTVCYWKDYALFADLVTCKEEVPLQSTKFCFCKRSHPNNRINDESFCQQHYFILCSAGHTEF